MKNLIIVLITLFSSFAWSVDLNERRAQLIETYLENQDGLWKISKDVPADYYLSFLGVNFPEANQLEMKAKAAVLYFAAATALLESKEQLSNLIDCKNSFDKYKVEIATWETKEGVEKNCPASGDQVATGVCISSSLFCKSQIEKYEPYYDKMMEINKKFTRTKFELNELATVTGMQSFSWLGGLLMNMKFDCTLGVGPKRAAIDINKACKALVEEEQKDMLTSHENEIVPTKSIKGENGVVTTYYYNPIPDCRYTKPHPRAPLYFDFGGRNGKGFFCEGSNLVGMLTPKMEILLLNSRVRAFYWLQMAEKYFEASKVNSIVETKVKTEKWEGPVKIFGSDGQLFSTKFQNSIQGKNYLNPLSSDYSDLSLLGNAYNANRKLTDNEKQIFNRLASKIKVSRDTALMLKRDVLDLLVKGKFNFGFELEHFQN